MTSKINEVVTSGTDWSIANKKRLRITIGLRLRLEYRLIKKDYETVPISWK